MVKILTLCVSLCVCVYSWMSFFSSLGSYIVRELFFFARARDPQVAFFVENVCACVSACQRYTRPQSQCGGGSSGHLLYLLNPSITCARSFLGVGDSDLSVLFLCETVILREPTLPTCPVGPPPPTSTVTSVLICHSRRASDFRYASKKGKKKQTIWRDNQCGAGIFRAPIDAILVPLRRSGSLPSPRCH